MAGMPNELAAFDSSASGTSRVTSVVVQQLTAVAGKMTILERILKELHKTTSEKIVVVSNWTSTLNIIQEMLAKLKFSYLRLDGSTPQKARHTLVEQFNKGRRDDSFVFLLSAKAGGAGINLIG